MHVRLRILSLLAVLALLVASCGTGPAKSGIGAAAPVALPQIAAGPHENVPSALSDPAAPGLKPLINPSDVMQDLPPDTIPAIDHPKFERADAVTWIHPAEPVIALTLGGESRAYPVQILVWHEIVNDTVGGTPVTVSFCPLCDTALAFDRRADGRVLSFGTSGDLYNSDLVMYDRQTQSLWVQFLGQAGIGFLSGTKLTAYPVQTVSWNDWRRAHPHDWVLSRDTGFDRPYGTNPYPGYDDIHSSPFLYSNKTDPRFPAMAHVVGIHAGSDSVAVPTDSLRRHPVIETTVNGQTIDVWFTPGTASALLGNYVAEGQDIGASGVFSPLVNGRHLHFTAIPDGFRDTETGSTWNILGHATAGPLKGSTLTPIAHVDIFWFAWAAFQPHTRVVSG